IAAIVGIIAKEGVFQYSIRIGRKIRSNLVIANAWHDRADALSSLASFAGIIGALAGYPILDAVGAVLVSLFILHMAFTIGWRSLQELLDTSLEMDLLQEIRTEALSSHPKALNLHNVRARRMGPMVLVDLHLDVPAQLTVVE